MYATSKEKKDGYDEHISKKGVVSYRKYFKTIEGNFVGIKLDDTHFGKQLRIKFKTTDDFIIVNIDMKNQKGGLGKYFKAFVKMMANLDKNTKYSFGANTTKKNPNGYLYESFYINNLEENTPVMWAIKNEDVPKPIKKEGKFGGADTWDYEPEDVYYFNIFEKEYDRLEDTEPRTTVFQNIVKQKEEESKEGHVPFEVNVEEDDLPF
jgi:hypothetical protein